MGGVERVVEKLAAGLVRRRFVVEVITTDPTGSLPAVEAVSGLSVRRFATIRHDAVFFLSPSLALWILRKAGGFDLIHAHSYHTPLAFISALAAWLHRVPLVVSPHYHGTGHTAARALLHRPYRLFGGWMIRQAALVICCSEAERSLIQLHFGSGVATKVVRYGVDREPGPAPAIWQASRGKTVLTGGRLEGYKQVGLVVRAMEHLPEDFRLVIFGEGPALADIQATARTSGVIERVEFVRRVTDEELGRHFRTANVFVSLSRNEAFGLTVAEAVAAGTTVVCSDIPAFREMADELPDGAIRLLDVDVDSRAVAEAIRAAADAPRPSFSASSRLPTWDDMVAETIDGFRGVLVGRGGPQLRRSS